MARAPQEIGIHLRQQQHGDGAHPQVRDWRMTVPRLWPEAL